MTTYLQALAHAEWTSRHASHLAWRAGLGETPQGCQKIYDLGVQEAVESFLSQLNPEAEFSSWRAYDRTKEFENKKEAEPIRAKIKETRDPQELKTLTAEKDRLSKLRTDIRRHSVEDLTIEWIHRLNTTTRPFSQKLLLFWHNHFAVSAQKMNINGHFMASYLDLLSKIGLSDWKTILTEVSKHPAMIEHLDNDSNVKGHPNENFARELMELFSLGIGYYTETDVLESARAFTGWTYEPATAAFNFNLNKHDDGVKTFLEKTGNFKGEEVIEIIINHPQASRFLAEKIWTYFAYENPEKELIEEFSLIIKKCNFNLKEIFRTLFLSQAFYSARSMGTQIKSPVQLVCGTIRFIRCENYPAKTVEKTLQYMGMDLAYPPDVNGWPCGSLWINTSTLLLRYNFMNFLINGIEFSDSKKEKKSENQPTLLDLKKIVDTQVLTSSEETVDFFLNYFIQRPLQSDLRDKLKKYLHTDRSGGTSSFDQNSPTAGEKIRGLIHLILSSPDYQLC